MIDLTVALRPATANVHSKVFDDDEVVVLDMRTGTYFSLRGSGVDVWELVEAHATGAQIVEAVADRYDGSPGEIGSAIEALLDELAQADLIVGDPSIEPAGSPRQPGGKAPFPAPELERFTDMQELLLLDPIHEVDETGWPHTPATR
jgi:Coenzyme PQQ synthesis protein D (PqqD)